MQDLVTIYQRFLSFGLTPQDVDEAIRSACEFFQHAYAMYDS